MRKRRVKSSSIRGFVEEFEFGTSNRLATFWAGRSFCWSYGGRRSELEKLIGDILDAGFFTSKQAEFLRGRLHWFESFSFGRIGKRYIKMPGDLAYRENRKIVLMQPELKALTFLKERVLAAPPIKLTSSSLKCWIIFIDGVVEGDDGQIGSVAGVLFSPHGSCHSFLGAEVPTRHYDIMGRLCKTSANPIYELEILLAVIAVALWGVQCVFYLDNDAARAAFIKGNASTLESSIFMDEFVQAELDLQLKSWVSRVPSHSNMADDPSRLMFDTVRALGAKQTEINWSWALDA